MTEVINCYESTCKYNSNDYNHECTCKAITISNTGQCRMWDSDVPCCDNCKWDVTQWKDNIYNPQRREICLSCKNCDKWEERAV